MKEVLLVLDDHKSKESVKQLGQVCSDILFTTDKLLYAADLFFRH